MGRIVPLLAMIASVAVLAFLGGMTVARLQVFPYAAVHNAMRTLSAMAQTLRPPKEWDFGRPIEAADLPADQASASRWTIVDPDSPRLPIIANGGINQYLELCPGQGCIAVTYGDTGEIEQSWPYRPEDIYAADITEGAFRHEILVFDPNVNVNPVSVQPYADGDILINFHSSRGPIFPYGMGVSRVGPDGAPRWTRFDFSHHWSTMREDGFAYVPGLIIGEGNVNFRFGSPPSVKHHSLKCDTGRPYNDSVQLIDGEGTVVEEINFVAMLVNSNWSGTLLETTDPCDPVHLNYIDVVGPDAGPGLAPGDLVLSLRNLSRFAILDRETRQIKHMMAGGFLQQHSVHHLGGTKFLVFDNRGGDAFGPASRIVEVDLATGGERRVFPNADTPEPFREVFTDLSGYLDISPDRQRVLASFTHSGRAFEVDIGSGRLLAHYDNVHDVSSMPDATAEQRQQAVRFSIYGMSYLRP